MGKSTNSVEQNQRMERYYQWQSKIYDSTRWSFLFGRKGVIKQIPDLVNPDGQILEVGCGTGFNLNLLAQRFPQAQIHGLDVSTDMINLSRKKTSRFGNRVELHHKPYIFGDSGFENLDLILFSYSLTMINPQWKELILQAEKDLKVGGMVAFVDFHDSKQQWFKNHMGNHHVRMDGHIVPMLTDLFEPKISKVKNAYLGVWEYALFVGYKRK